MREYIKKFETAASADNYAIVDIPFTSTIGGGTLTNLTCNQENKKIVVDGDNIDIVDATIIGQFFVTDVDSGHDVGSWDFEVGMTWRQFVNSKYNNDNEFHINDNDSLVKYYYSTTYSKTVECVEPNDVIEENGNYTIY